MAASVTHKLSQPLVAMRTLVDKREQNYLNRRQRDGGIPFLILNFTLLKLSPIFKQGIVA
jgi:hypothetical protein